MERCPCCQQPKGTCGCQLEWLAAASGDKYEWCTTHQRTVERDLVSQGIFEEQVEELSEE